MILQKLKQRLKVSVFLIAIFFSASLTAQTSGNVTLGETSITLTGLSSTSPIFPNTKFVRYQTIYTKAEIQAAGGAAGLITSLGWRVGTATSFYSDYTIRMGHTSGTTLSAHNTSATVQVFSAAAINFTTGYNMLALSSGFNWNGNDNILIDICYSRTSANSGTNSGSVYNYTAPSPATRYRNSTGATSVCPQDTQYTGFSAKPVIRFVMPMASVTCNPASNLSAESISPSGATISWNAPAPAPASGYETFYSTSSSAPVTTGVATTSLSRNITGLQPGTTYFYWVRSKCSTTSYSEWMGSQFTTSCIAPTINSSGATAICGSGTSTLSAVASAGSVYWYDSAIGGNLLGTGSTYITPTLTSTTSYYAAAGQSTSTIANSTVGAGSLTSTSFAAYSTPFYAYGSQKTQYIIRASELTAAGLAPGIINSIALDIVSVGNPTLSAFSISAGNTSIENATSTFATGLTSVYSKASQAVSAGINTYNFTTPFNWNGGNIVLQICWNNGNASTSVNTIKYDNTAFQSQVHLYNVSSSGSVSCSAATGTSTHNSRPKFIINGNSLCLNETRTEITAIVIQPSEYYNDLDGDGWGAGEPILLCEPTTGLVSNNGDCDDTNAEIFPGAVEITGNGIDENCNGMADDAVLVTTQIKAHQCGTTLANIYTSIQANSVVNTTMYRFEVTNTSTNAVQYIESSNPWFSLTQLASYDYATTYSIAVELFQNDDWLGYYGPACNVSTPGYVGQSAPTIKQCGATLANLYTAVNANVISGATGYLFRITNQTNPDGPNAIQTVERTVPWFNLTSLESYDYGTSYGVEVAFKTSGTYSPYGAMCTVTTPDLPMSNLRIKQCGAVYVNTYSAINALVIPNVSAYKFRVTNLSTNDVQEIEPAQSWIFFSQFTYFSYGTTFSIEVAVKTTDSFSEYGQVCTVTTPAARFESEPLIADLKVVASPNPYSDTFALTLTSNADSVVEVKVFDMIGKLLEVREVAPADIEAQKLGSQLPAGVYNVIVTQGTEIKSVRVIKRN